MKDEIVVYEDELTDVSSLLSNSGKEVSSTCENINPSFSGAVSVGLLGNSVGTISDQMGSIYKSIDNVKTAIDEFTVLFMTYDKDMATKINDIDIPNDYLANDSSTVNTYSEVALQKYDGESVNDGNDASGLYTLDDSSINKTKIYDISTSGLTYQSYDDESSISKETLGDIDKVSTVDGISYDDKYELEQNFMLIDMIERDAPLSFTYDDTSKITEKEVFDEPNTYVESYDYVPYTSLEDKENIIETE